MHYPAKFEAAPEGGFVVTFRDIPEAITQGDTLDEALEMATDVLVSAMDFYFEDQRSVPLPSAPLAGEYLVSLPPSVYTKVLLLNAFLESQMPQAELARKMQVRPQEVTRLLDLRHSTKIDTLSQAFGALGRQLLVDVQLVKPSGFPPPPFRPNA